jgi:hypothetical protein
MRGSPFECVPALRMRSQNTRDLQSRDPCRRCALEGSLGHSAERVVRWRHDYTGTCVFGGQGGEWEPCMTISEAGEKPTRTNVRSDDIQPEHVAEERLQWRAMNATGVR